MTYHHNWFDETPQRNPRVRFGEPVHVGVACQANGGCMVEGNYIQDVEEPSAYYSYTLDNPSDVKAIVTAGAGVGKIGL